MAHSLASTEPKDKSKQALGSGPQKSSIQDFRLANSIILTMHYSHGRMKRSAKTARFIQCRVAPVKAKSTGESRVGEANEDLHSFLVRELPPGKTKQASYLMEVLREAGARFDRYDAKRNEWLNYATRRSRLATITNLLEELESCLCDLDILSRDELANRVDPKMIETFVGSIRLLRKETTNLAKETQKNGRPRELAEEMDHGPCGHLRKRFWSTCRYLGIRRDPDETAGQVL